MCSQLTKRLVAVGDYVKEDETVGEIETDKTSIGIPAPCGGYVVELLAEDGATVLAGQEIYKLRVSGMFSLACLGVSLFPLETVNC